MKDAAARSKLLAGILKKQGKVAPPEVPGSDDPIAVLVFSFLLWECNTTRALTAYKHIVESVVDFNDLRVSMPHEMIDLIGARYPRGEERCERLRAALRDVYGREHVVSLERLKESGKREVRKYLDSLEGIVPYVASRVALLSFDVHAMPVDEQLRDRLAAEQIIEPDADFGDVATWLERQIKASDGRTAHFGLQAWLENDAGKRRSTPRTGSTTRKTSKKATTGTKRKTTRKTARP